MTMLASSIPPTQQLGYLTNLLAEAEQLERAGNVVKAVHSYNEAILIPTKDGEALKSKELAILRVAQLLKSINDASGLDQFIRGLEPVWPFFPRAKSAKLVRDLLDLFDELSSTSNAAQATQATKLELALIKDLIAWCVQDKRTFLKQSLESRLGSLYLKAKMYSDALALIAELLRELKRMDDKVALVQVHLLECQVYFAIKNLPKAKAALTAARSAANAVYCPPLLQAALDLQSGILHGEDNDFKTAYSYFIEAIDAFTAGKDMANGAACLKYMILCKIMNGHAEEIDALVTGKVGQRYSLGREVEAMKAVGEAYKTRSLKDFEAALKAYPAELTADPIIQTHFNSLYDALLQKNILRIIQPYSRIQIPFIAESIGLDAALIEKKLSQMILDRTLNGILDQAANCLVVIEEVAGDATFRISLDVFKHLDTVVDSLYLKAAKL